MAYPAGVVASRLPLVKSQYRRIHSTKSPASGAGTFSKPTPTLSTLTDIHTFSLSIQFVLGDDTVCVCSK